MKLCIITASLDPAKTEQYWRSWEEQGVGDAMPTVLVIPDNLSYSVASLRIADFVVKTPGIVGVVPAFTAGVRRAVELDFDLIACFHDDLRIDERGWDRRVVDFFADHPRCGLMGFGGAAGVGDSDIYQKPYEPHQLARVDFFSNMSDAENHGRRELSPRRAACFDGFSQIGRGSLMLKLFERLTALKIIHHCFDSALGAMSIREGWENYYLPIFCHHAGGVTAVGSAAYNEWAKTQRTNGDQGFWEESHRILYDELRDVLPIRVEA